MTAISRQNFRYVLRSLARSPTTTLACLLTLALGIGANCTIFSLVDTVLLAPLPYPAPERLVAVYSRFPLLGFDRFWVSPPEYLDLRSGARSFEDLGAYRQGEVNLTGRSEPLRVRAAWVSSSFFSTLRIPPERGRIFTAAEDLRGVEPTLVLSNELWHRGFGADPQIVGKRASLDGVPRTVIGVMPAGFEIGESKPEIWLPLALGPLDPAERSRHQLSILGRLRAGVSVAAARAELAGLLDRWPHEMPDVHVPSAEEHPLVISPLRDDLVGDIRPSLLVLWGAVSLLLLIACANIANLLLARAKARQPEIATRLALGASRRSLLGLFLVESLALSILGGGLGLVFAGWAGQALLALSPTDLPRFHGLTIEPRVMGFALLSSLACGLLFGLAPALSARDTELIGILRQGDGRSGVGWRRQRLQRGLVVAEVALATALSICGGLLVRSFVALEQVDPGFDGTGVLTVHLDLPETRYPEAHQVLDLQERLIARLSTLPGVEAVGTMSGLPPLRELDAVDAEFASVPVDPSGPAHNVNFFEVVGGDYFRAMKIRLVAGRFFGPTDGPGSPPVAVVNETMARVFWPGRSPIGDRFRSPEPGRPWVSIVGIAADVKQQGLEEKSGTEFYLLASQAPDAVGDVRRSFHLAIRGTNDRTQLASAIRATVHEIDRDLPLDSLRPMREVLKGSMARPRFVALLVTLFAIAALLLAALGIYGVFAHAVEIRAHEIGMRMALGGQAKDIVRLLLFQVARLAAFGVLLGVALAFGIGRLMSSLLFGISAADPMSFAVVVILLGAVALAASLLPALRAVKLDAVSALRQ